MTSTYKILLIGLTLGLSGAAHADSAENASDASADMAGASARLVASGVQVASGAVAVPLAASSALSNASGAVTGVIAEDLWESANAPLTIDEDIAIAAQPLPTLEVQPKPQQQ